MTRSGVEFWRNREIVRAVGGTSIIERAERRISVTSPIVRHNVKGRKKVELKKKRSEQKREE